MKQPSKKAVSPQHLPLQAWAPDDPTDRLESLAEDMRTLMRDKAMLQESHREGQRRAQEDKRRQLLALLDINDAFERVFLNIHQKQDRITEQMQKWINNFRTIQKLLLQLLEAEGVVRLQSIEAEFNPQWHSAIDTLRSASLPGGTIIREESAGYMWRDELLRKAEVIVAE